MIESHIHGTYIVRKRRMIAYVAVCANGAMEALRTGGRKLDNSATSVAEVRWTGPCTPSASSLVHEISPPIFKSCHLVAP